MISWTASHIDTRAKLTLLKFMIDSLLECGIDSIYISLSYNNDLTDTVDKIKQICEKIPVNLFIHDNPMFQFDHLSFIYDHCKSINLSDETQILFIDDDDLLLNVPAATEHSVEIIQGLHCRCASKYMANRQDIVLADRTTWDSDVDFSGYSCKFKHLHEYFMNRKVYTDADDTFGLLEPLAHLEDLQFMKYLDDLGAIEPASPFIFYRMWCTENRPVATWRQSLIKALESLAKKY